MSGTEEDEDYEYEYESDDESDNDPPPELGSREPSTTSSTSSIGNYNNQIVNDVSDSGYSMLSYDDVVPIMKSLIKEVSKLLEVSTCVSEVLLRNHRWNKEILFNEYCSGEETFWINSGVNRLSNKESAVSDDVDGSNECGGGIRSTESKDRKRRKEIFSCGICLEDFLYSDGFALDCGHMFCRDCFQSYLHAGVDDGPTCVRLSCPQHECHIAISSYVFKTLCSMEHFQKYIIYLTRHFIEMSSTMRWCSSPGCTKVAVVPEQGDTNINITCTSCHNEFCFRCGYLSHTPLSCELLGQWIVKCQNESENALWIATNTKSCPKCKNRIEKNGGCQHMTCKMCKHGFCWHCLSPWAAAGHTWNHANCAVFIPLDDSKEKESIADLERYIRYFSRYDGHDKAIKFAGRQRENAKLRMDAMMEQKETAAGASKSFIDVEYLIRAVEQIIEGRKILKYSYAFGYFLQDGVREKLLFENALEMMEKHIDDLSELTEHTSIDKVSDAELDRQRCINLTSAINKSLTSLLETINEQFFQFWSSNIAINSHTSS